MYIEELLPGQKVTLQVNVNGSLLSFDTVVQETNLKKNFILLDPIMQGNKGISFKGEGITVDLIINQSDEKPLIFQDITILLQKKQDGMLCYLVTCEKESMVFNRRENFRCYISIPTYIQCSGSASSHDAIIRDVSYTGFSIVCSPELNIERGHLIHALLHDRIEETSANYSFNLYGLVSRSQVLPNGNVLYGCRLNGRVPGLDQYIMTKERYRLRKTSGM